MQLKHTLWLVCLILTFACNKSKKQAPEVAKVPPLAKADFNLDVDPDIARILSEPPPGGFLPKNIKWAPDSSSLTYIRSIMQADGKLSELWIRDIKSGQERPLKSGSGMSISEYDWCGKTSILAISKGDLYEFSLEGEIHRLTETETTETSLRCSPDGTKVAFVRDHNIVTIDLAKQTERQVTEEGTLEKTLGEVAWVYGEEFGAKDGFGWSKDSTRIWFYETDSKNVTRRVIVTDASGESREQFYPSPGEPNPLVRVGIADLRTVEPKVSWLETGKESDVYLPKIMWIKGSKELLVVRLDRLQTMLDLLRCDASKGSCDTIVTERDPHWINRPRPPKIIRGGKEFLWLLERDGFFHIHRFDMDGRVLGQLTEGKWVVTSIDGVDEKKGIIYFRANIERPTDYGLYSVNVSSREVLPLSTLDGSHRADFSPDLKYYIDTHSALGRPPRKDLFRRSGEPVATISAHDLREYAGPRVTTDFMPVKTFDGEILNARLTRPRAIDPKKQYPVLVYVYGGPGAQVVKNEFRTKYNPWMYLLASRGILVFSVDGRGTFGRGHEFETAIHRRLGEIELKDQLAGVAYLKTLPFVDPKRIGVFGWSYGGTMVLNAMLRTKDVFKAGAAVAPVTDWRQYDTAYTERFMQRPQDNPEGYADMSLLKVAGNLNAPLLLIHGLSDDNVHFTNTALLMDELVKAKKHFELMVYPGKDHGIRGDGYTLSHVFSTITSFFERHL